MLPLPRGNTRHVPGTLHSSPCDLPVRTIEKKKEQGISVKTYACKTFTVGFRSFNYNFRRVPFLRRLLCLPIRLSYERDPIITLKQQI